MIPIVETRHNTTVHALLVLLTYHVLTTSIIWCLNRSEPSAALALMPLCPAAENSGECFIYPPGVSSVCGASSAHRVNFYTARGVIKGP